MATKATKQGAKTAQTVQLDPAEVAEQRAYQQQLIDEALGDQAPIRRWVITQGRHRITSEMSADEVRQVLRRARPRLREDRGDG